MFVSNLKKTASWGRLRTGQSGEQAKTFRAKIYNFLPTGSDVGPVAHVRVTLTRNSRLKLTQNRSQSV